MSLDIHRCRFVDFSSHPITALEFSSSSSKDTSVSDVRLAVGRSNGDIEIWNPRWGWVHELTLRGGRGRSVEGLAWAQPKGESPRLFSIGGSTSVTEWDLSTSLPVANYQCDAGVIWSLAASPDGTQLVVGCDNGSVVLLDISGGMGIIEYSRILQRQDARVLSIAWRGNDQVVGGLADARIRVWSTKAENHGKILGTMKVDQSKEQESTLVWFVKVINPKLMVSGDSTGCVKFWDLSRFSLLQTFDVHEADVLCLTADAAGENVYSAGVDRKIVNYRLVNKSLGRWSSMSSRMLHSHDVRAMALHESSNSSFLVSGGVERTFIVTDAYNFGEGDHKKIPITLQQPPLAAVPSSRLLMFWNDQTIKIWKIGATDNTTLDEDSQKLDVENKKLVSKMTLSNDENITSAQISSDGELLVVSTIAETKIFNLTASPSGKALKVTKQPAHDLEDQGARLIRIIEGPHGQNRLLIVSPESDLTIYTLTKNEEGLYDVDLDVDPLELELQSDPKFKSKSKLNYIDSIHIADVSADGRHLAVTRYSGAVDIFDLSVKEPTNTLLGKFSAVVTALKFTSRNTLIVVTAEIKVLEYDILTGSLTAWSRQNSEILPNRLVDISDKCCGVFFDPQNSHRMWLWGSSWLGFLDTSVNIPVQRIPKRKRDRLGIDDNRNDDDEQTNAEILARAEERQKQDEEENIGSTAFWITQKYRPIILADTIGSGELVVVEQPLHKIPLPPAFWSNHRITL